MKYCQVCHKLQRIFFEENYEEKTKMSIESVSQQNYVIMTSPSNELEKHE
jgi:hypothetical protein